MIITTNESIDAGDDSEPVDNSRHCRNKLRENAKVEDEETKGTKGKETLDEDQMSDISSSIDGSSAASDESYRMHKERDIVEMTSDNEDSNNESMPNIDAIVDGIESQDCKMQSQHMIIQILKRQNETLKKQIEHIDGDELKKEEVKKMKMKMKEEDDFYDEVAGIRCKNLMMTEQLGIAALEIKEIKQKINELLAALKKHKVESDELEKERVIEKKVTFKLQSLKGK